VVFPPAIHLLLIFPAQATAVIQVYQEPADRLAFQELADVVAQAAILVILEFREQAVIRVLAPAEQAASQVLPPLASLATLVYQELLVILVWEHLVRLANQVHPFFSAASSFNNLSTMRMTVEHFTTSFIRFSSCANCPARLASKDSSMSVCL
jgi:hypothetical protein